MATPHNNANPGDYADIVLMPGDPARAFHIANTFLTDMTIVNVVRNNHGYTGWYGGKRVSVQASGMGQPSLAIYATELFDHYNVKTIIRLGTCGAVLPAQKIGDCVIALSAGSSGNMTRDEYNYAPCCDYDTLYQFMRYAETIDPWVGQMMSVDNYYNNNVGWAWPLTSSGVVGVDMETHALYHIAATKMRRALSINVVSDYVNNANSGVAMSPDDKVSALNKITEYVLESC